MGSFLSTALVVFFFVLMSSVAQISRCIGIFYKCVFASSDLDASSSVSAGVFSELTAVFLGAKLMQKL